MKINLSRKLFWFLKDNVSINLSDPSSLEMYMQQVISHGKTEDIKFLLTHVKSEQLQQTFLKIKRLLPWEVRAFWEDFFANNQQSSRRDS